jgi:hypothetical protein
MPPQGIEENHVRNAHLDACFDACLELPIPDIGIVVLGHMSFDRDTHCRVGETMLQAEAMLYTSDPPSRQSTDVVTVLWEVKCSRAGRLLTQTLQHLTLSAWIPQPCRLLLVTNGRPDVWVHMSLSAPEEEKKEAPASPSSVIAKSDSAPHPVSVDGVYDELPWCF